MSPKPKVVQTSNQATPFAEDFMKQLMMGSVGFASPLQRNIGSAFDQLIAGGPQFFDHSKQFDALRAQYGLTTSTGAADLAEKFSIGGSRYGTAAGVGLGRYQAQRGADLDALLSNIAFQSWSDANNRYLSALGGAGTFSQNALGPYVALATQGIVNPAVFMQENPFVSGLKAVGGAAAGVAPFL